MKTLIITIAAMFMLSACNAGDHAAATDNHSKGEAVFKSDVHKAGACGLRKKGKSSKSHGHGVRSCANHTHDSDAGHGHSNKAKKLCNKAKKSCACKKHDEVESHGHAH